MSSKNFRQVTLAALLLLAAGWREFGWAFPVGGPRALVRPTAFGAGTSVFASGGGGNEAATSIGDDDDDVFENVAAAVVVPGFLTGADEFDELCERLTAKGIPTVAVPMPNWHWLPCLGGRSARPILERIDFTVQHLVANLETQENAILADKNNAILNIPKYQYSLWDCYQDFRHNPGGALAVGGSSKVDDYPVVEPRGFFPPPKHFRQGGDAPKKKIALIGHRYVQEKHDKKRQALATFRIKCIVSHPTLPTHSSNPLSKFL